MLSNALRRPALRLLLALAVLACAHCGDLRKIGDSCFNRDECPGAKGFPGECALNLPSGYCTRGCILDTDCDPGTQCQSTGLGQVCVKKCKTSADCRITDGIICIEAGMRSYCGLPQ